MNHNDMSVLISDAEYNMMESVLFNPPCQSCQSTHGDHHKKKKHQPAMPLLLNMIMPSVIVAMIMRVQCSTIYIYIYIFIVIYNN